MGKYLDKADKEQIRKIKGQHKKIVLCHGVFDLVHPGHIIHFQEAKKLGDILVVSITSAQFVRKGPGRPYFNDEMRMRQLEAIDCIDYVMLSEGYTVDDIIEALEPDLYVKGKEYAKAEDDITGMIDEEAALVRKHGGDIAYTEGAVFSSTKLLNHALPVLSPDVKEFMEDFCKRYTMSDIKLLAEKMQNLKVLVVGDAIIDQYIFCTVQGLMSKDMGYSSRYHSSESYLGGALAIARHLSSFSDQVTLMTVLGKEEEIHSRILDEMGSQMRLDITMSENYETIVKKRFVSLNEKREEVHKIFAINNLSTPMCIDEDSMNQFYTKLLAKITEYDLVILCDFGHGLIDSKVMDIVQNKSKLLAVNCQTNSSNYGKNIITKYHRADLFVLDQKELGLAFSDYSQNEEQSLLRLSEYFGSPGWLTQGSKGASAVEAGKVYTCPAFTLKVKDTIGAGDAFFAIACLSVAVGASIELGMFLGNIAGALATNIIGNKETVEKVNVLKYAATLLNI